MKPFSEQLSAYVQRAGISDAELARRLGVSRQTIFRWREGTTHSPRQRADVLRLAEALRLTPEERDQLLLSAGFRPERPPAPSVPEAEFQPASGRTSSGDQGPEVASAAPAARLRRGPRLRAVAFAIAGLALAVLLATGWWREAPRLFGLESGSDPQPAAAGETLVLVAEFVNYGGSGIGFNVQDRLAEALRSEFDEAGLAATRVEELGKEIASADQARAEAGRLGAEFVLWGEYDSGRVIVFLTGTGPAESSLAEEQRWLLSSLDELSVTINVALPQEVQWMGPYGVGLAHFRAGRDLEAEAALRRALQGAPDDPHTLAGLYFTLGVIEGRAPQPDLDQTIALYTEAVERSPGLVSAWNNRGAAYLKRGAAGDLGRAEADFRRAMQLAPDFAPAPFNLALALSQGAAPDLEAVIDLLQQSEALEAENAHLQNGLCWFLSLADQAEQALPHCELAVELDQSGYSNDSYGVALALLGRHSEAAEQFATFLDLLIAEDPEAHRVFQPSRSEWIARLEAGENPFDSDTLRALLSDVEPP